MYFVNRIGDIIRASNYKHSANASQLLITINPCYGVPLYKHLPRHWKATHTSGKKTDCIRTDGSGYLTKLECIYDNCSNNCCVYGGKDEKDESCMPSFYIE